MSDIATITATLSGLKTAIDIAKAIKDADVSIEKAELKYKIAELISALADAKVAAAETIELIENKERQIVELESKLSFSKTLERFKDAYFETHSGAPVGDPYCAHCWEVDKVAVHLKTGANHARMKECPRCKTQHMSHTVK